MIFVDRARMTTPTVGTGPLTLGTPVSAFQSFAAAGVGDDDQVEYLIEDGAAWEIGIGTYTVAGAILARAMRSSSTGALLNLSGTALVSVVPTAWTLTRLGTTTIEQQVAAADWNIIHNLARYPAIEIVDSAGHVMEGLVTYISENEITVSFSAAFSGVAYLN